ncbi:hypothetical protein [Allonocardiopsis opalescens]|uniref:Uncharacterized protein n=1 Tax=Allonocardiopsis opalescens TaxID=1144618 RepID=A0A2T0Q6Z5_9ACTN|nr:hypothetical protein [Allonocardiopsis opalescens]PRX99588.1 hypothetical protein CLV72_103190 [Allonocardiopsis opalescens]
MTGPDPAPGPAADPLGYPGVRPDRSGLLTGDGFAPLRPAAGAPLGEWAVEPGGTLARRLAAAGAPALDVRRPVLAVGANAAPARLRRKFDGRAPMEAPMVLAEVRGLEPGVSAHVNRAGYLPAAPVARPGAAGRLFVLWLTAEQLRVLDATEPNYRRRAITADRATVLLPSGLTVPALDLYVSRHGCLADGAGLPWPLADQRAMIGELLAGSARLRRLCGPGPDEFVRRAAEPAVRDAVRGVLRAEGRVLDQPELTGLPPGTEPPEPALGRG